MPMMPVDPQQLVYRSSHSVSYSRYDAISFFSDDRFHIGIVPNMRRILFPKFTNKVVGGISSAKAIGFYLVLLCFLPSIAAAERGKHRVVLSNGRKNSLSCIFHIGAESGAGKGLALEENFPFLQFRIGKLKSKLMMKIKKGLRRMC